MKSKTNYVHHNAEFSFIYFRFREDAITMVRNSQTLTIL
jgi:hypothetical protein